MRQSFYCLCIVILCMSGCGKNESAVVCEAEAIEEPIEEWNLDSTDEKREIFIHVCGCVNSPGVFRLEEGMRIQDALQAAGGMTEEADTDYLNQAEVLTDGQKIYVPSEEEVKERLQSNVENGKININTAGIGELTTLSGVGESRAQAIIQYREAHQGFRSIDEIMKIEGIKEGVFQKIKDSIVIE